MVSFKRLTNVHRQDIMITIEVSMVLVSYWYALQNKALIKHFLWAKY